MSDGGGRRGGGGYKGSPSSGQFIYREKSQSPVTTVDKSLDESCSNKGKGSRGRGRSTVSLWVPKTSSVSATNEHTPVQACSNNLDECSAFKCSGSNKDLLQSSRDCEADKDDVAGSYCDPLNRTEDVVSLLSSSTLDHKVKESSLEDHDSERKTKPFDLILTRNAMGLKPSLSVISKEKKKAAKGYTGSVIRPGMVLLKNYLSINDQVMLVNKCRQLGLGEGGFYQPGYSDGAKLHLNMMCLGKNWDPETSRYGETRPFDGSVPPPIPVEFSLLVRKAIKESQSLVVTNPKKMNGEDEIPSMSPDICIVNFYTSTGRLGLHKDKDESGKSIREGLPVVSFSIGDSAEFVYCDQRNEDKTEMITLESGDVLLFGGKSRNIFHGVRSILKDTAPKVLVHETDLRPGRLNLTFRQY